MSAQPQQAAREVISGEPKAAARKWLGPTALVMFVLFAVDTYLVTAGVLTRPFDVPITTFVQSINFGPVTVSKAGTASKCANGVSPSLMETIEAHPSNYYMTVNTKKFPKGALRGQVTHQG